LGNIAQNFDDVYRTGYVDLDSGFYRSLTANVVRSPREARQILLKAVGSGEVERMKIVQALRSLSRKFDDKLEVELAKAAVAKEPVAVMDGKPILSRSQEPEDTLSIEIDEFVLASPSQMIENINGEWRLQLLADKKGDGVKFFNKKNTLSWQQVDTELMQFSSVGRTGFISVEESGGLEFEAEKRVLRRSDVETSSGMLGTLFPNVGASSSLVPQQIITVDSVLLITRCVPNKRRSAEEVKDYFAVWRRVEPGTYATTK
jgi:hypothetical protein